MNRNTIQRQIIRDILHENCFSHLTADDIYIMARDKNPSISKGTVYRNLKLLASSGEISEIAVPDGSKRYEWIKEPHHHLHCRKCGKVFDSKLPFDKEWKKHLGIDSEFMLESYELKLTGICKDCQKKMN